MSYSNADLVNDLTDIVCKKCPRSADGKCDSDARTLFQCVVQALPKVPVPWPKGEEIPK